MTFPGEKFRACKSVPTCNFSSAKDWHFVFLVELITM